VLDLPNRKGVVFVETLGADLLVSDPPVVESYSHRIRSVLGEALFWQKSTGFIERLKKELYGHD